MEVDLPSRTHWIFDMDGTLTVAAHDFPAIRNALGINDTGGIIEAIDSLPEKEAKQKHRQLSEIEIDYAEHSKEQPGAGRLLAFLSERKIKLGILTRNSVQNAIVTLKECNLEHFFSNQDILGRDSAAPKPSPDGINLLLRNWDVDPSSAVMVGDYKYDLEAGRRAETATIYVDVNEENLWSDLADLHVSHLDQIIDSLKNS